MASIRNSFNVNTTAEAAWDAVRDFGAVHTRLAPGFVADARLEGDARILTFANGHIAREMLVDRDDDARRLVYAIPPNERIGHYNAVLEVFAEADNRCRICWSIDLLPHALQPMIAAQMDLGIAAMQKALRRANEPQAAPSAPTASPPR